MLKHFTLNREETTAATPRDDITLSPLRDSQEATDA